MQRQCTGAATIVSRLVAALGLALSIAACSGGNGGNGGSGGGVVIDDFGVESATVTMQVPISGGTVVLPNVATIFFPASSFTVATDVSVTTSSSTEIGDIFANTSAIFAPGSRLNHDIRINIGVMPINGDVSSVDVSVTVPAAFVAALADGYDVEVFALISNNGGEENYVSFDLITGAFDANVGTVAATIPAGAFVDAHTLDGTFELVLLLASTPETIAATLSANAAPSSCPLDPIRCPVESGCTVTSDFQENILDPADARRHNHTGADYLAASGSTVVAAKSGRVLRSEPDNGALGNVIVIQHDDASRTLYAHLQNRDVNVDAAVDAGDHIGLSGSTGQSSNPHLHFEYVPNGTAPGSKKRIDPHACLRGPDRFVGKWRITEDAVSSDPGCSGTSSFDATISIQEGTYFVSFPSGITVTTTTSTSNSLGVAFSGNFYDDGGTTSETGSGTFTRGGSFAGSTRWSWTDGSYSCSGTSEFSGQKL